MLGSVPYNSRHLFEDGLFAGVVQVLVDTAHLGCGDFRVVEGGVRGVEAPFAARVALRRDA